MRLLQHMYAAHAHARMLQHTHLQCLGMLAHVELESFPAAAVDRASLAAAELTNQPLLLFTVTRTPGNCTLTVCKLHGAEADLLYSINCRQAVDGLLCIRVDGTWEKCGAKDVTAPGNFCCKVSTWDTGRATLRS